MHDDLRRMMLAGWKFKFGWDDDRHAFRALATRSDEVLDETAPEPMEALAKVLLTAKAITP